MKPAPRSLSLRAPAKVNLYLEVIGRRPDGYHELRMLMAPVSLFDELTLTLQDRPGRIQVECEDAGVEPGEGNLCHRAARFYSRETGSDEGVHVFLRKRIPVGAGLGGGSSDAAATILGLEALCGRGLSAEARRRAAREVGADVPFFFAQSAAWVEGIGEAVTPATSFPPLWLVIVHPGILLSTAAVYSRFSKGLTTQGRPNTIQGFGFSEIARGLRNDLEPAALALEPCIGDVIAALKSAGSEAALVSGSGSAAFGLFREEGRAREAAALLSVRSPGWRIETVHTLAPGAFPFP